MSMRERERKLKLTLTQPSRFYWSELLSINFLKVRWRNTMREENWWWWWWGNQKVSCVYIYLEPSVVFCVELGIGFESIL